ncbi:MAG: helix-turn-helix domain-containing protein [Nitrospiria bacterium]
MNPEGIQALKQIGKALRTLREKRGLSQVEMESLGVSHRYYQRIESGKANITIKTLVEILDALGFEFRDIFQLMAQQEDGLD